MTSHYKYPAGVSIVICCHNGEHRLGPTLEHIARQETGDVLWELIVIDNASTDDTFNVARDLWPKRLKRFFKVVKEHRPGLVHARLRGFQEANYSVVSFVDDDNWICQNWITRVFEFMSQHPRIGAMGGVILAKCEVEPPEWFQRNRGSYAVTPLEAITGIVPLSTSYLYGAGMTIRRQAWDEIIAAGFSFMTVGRKGKILSSGEDSEVCMALRFKNWGLYVDDQLSLIHSIQKEKLNWDYLRRLNRGFGISKFALDQYYAVLDHNIIRRVFRRIFFLRLIVVISKLICYFLPYLLVHVLGRQEGKELVLKMEYNFGLLFAIFQFNRPTIPPTFLNSGNDM